MNANCSVQVIAELAQSYEGSFADAERLVRAAAGANADAMKFQVFSADELAVPGYKYYKLYRELEFKPDRWSELFELARSLGLQAYADVFGLQSVAMLSDLNISGFKIHSADMSNRPLIERVAQTGKHVILSCGGSTFGEIAEAVRIVLGAGAEKICLMHGFQASPTAVENTAFLRLAALKRAFGLPVGFADHIAGGHELAEYWPLPAVAAGATVIEKHLTLNRADQKEDYISALQSDEFRKMVLRIRALESAMGRDDFDMSAAEIEYRAESRKRIVASRAIGSGTVLKAEDLVLKRAVDPSEFFDPRQIIGRTLRVAIAQNAVIAEGELQPQSKRLRLVATLACRAASSRLYAKPLQRIGDRTILEYLVARIQSVPRIDQTVLAISEGTENKIFLEFADKLGLNYVIGDERDVQERLIMAGEKARADLLLRATTESPFLYSDNIEFLVSQHIEQSAMLTVCEGLPDGAYCEIITLSALKDAHERGEDRHRSELCTLYMFEHPERYKTLRFQAPEKLRRQDIRLTVDYPEDLIVCREIANALGKDGPLFSLESIVDFLDARPQLNAINNWIDAGHGRIWN